MGGKLTHQGKKEVDALVNEKIAWIEDNEDASVWEFRRQKNRMEDKIKLILDKMANNEEVKDRWEDEL